MAASAAAPRVVRGASRWLRRFMSISWEVCRHFSGVSQPGDAPAQCGWSPAGWTLSDPKRSKARPVPREPDEPGALVVLADDRLNAVWTGLVVAPSSLHVAVAQLREESRLEHIANRRATRCRRGGGAASAPSLHAAGVPSGMPISAKVSATAATACRISLAPMAPMQPTRKVSICVSLPGYRMKPRALAAS